MPNTPTDLTDQEIAEARGALFGGLVGGVFHLHLRILGPEHWLWVLVPVNGDYGGLCGTRRCIKLAPVNEAVGET
jgi:hypothetical protein